MHRSGCSSAQHLLYMENVRKSPNRLGPFSFMVTNVVARRWRGQSSRMASTSKPLHSAAEPPTNSAQTRHALAAPLMLLEQRFLFFAPTKARVQSWSATSQKLRVTPADLFSFSIHDNPSLFPHIHPHSLASGLVHSDERYLGLFHRPRGLQDFSSVRIGENRQSMQVPLHSPPAAIHASLTCWG